MSVANDGDMLLVVPQAAVAAQDDPAQGAFDNNQQAGEDPEEHHSQAGKLHNSGEVKKGHSSQGNDTVDQGDLEEVSGILL